MHKPSWFRDGKVFVSYAPTCGINKDGEELYVFDSDLGVRTPRIDDRLLDDVRAVRQGALTDTATWVDCSDIEATGIAVPAYYDRRTVDEFRRVVRVHWPDCVPVALGDLIDDGRLVVRPGHGSPSADMRTGTIPYIKVSDLRAGQVNINPTNRVAPAVARQYWRAGSSGLAAFDLLTPSRTSKNIGDIAVLMPGQEEIVLTKEILVIRPGPAAPFDSFFLLWALSLRLVRQQWNRIIFMQTNREDTGTRYREIEIPLPRSPVRQAELSEPFRTYYEGAAKLRADFLDFLARDEHHHVYLAASAARLEDGGVPDDPLKAGSGRA